MSSLSVYAIAPMRNSLRYRPAVSVFYFLIAAFVGLIVASVIMGVLLAKGATTSALRIAAVTQDLLVFIVPAVITAIIVSQLPARLLAVDRGVDGRMFFLACLLYICGTPMLEAVVKLNDAMTLPSFLSDVERWMRQMEENARGQVKLLLGGETVADLVVSILIVGVMAGFSEELFFRGALQRLLGASRLGPHAAIWITATLFSAFHMQFFGFFPRLILGAYFGYLLWWSGSIWLPVAIHILNNIIVVATQWAGAVSDTPLTDGTFSDTSGSMALSFGSTTLLLASFISSVALIRLLVRRSQSLRKC